MTQHLQPGVSEPVFLVFSRQHLAERALSEPPGFLRRLTGKREVALGLPGDLCEAVTDGIVGMVRNPAAERIEGDEYRQQEEACGSLTAVLHV